MISQCTVMIRDGPISVIFFQSFNKYYYTLELKVVSYWISDPFAMWLSGEAMVSTK